MKTNTNLFLLFKEFPGQDGKGFWMFQTEDENVRKDDIASKYSVGGCVISKCLANEEISGYINNGKDLTHSTTHVYAGEVIYGFAYTNFETCAERKYVHEIYTYGLDGKLITIDQFDFYDLCRIFKIKPNEYVDYGFFVNRGGMLFEIVS